MSKRAKTRGSRKMQFKRTIFTIRKSTCFTVSACAYVHALLALNLMLPDGGLGARTPITALESRVPCHDVSHLDDAWDRGRGFNKLRRWLRIQSIGIIAGRH